MELVERRILLVDVSQTMMIGNLSNPIAMDFSPDGKLFVVEQAGTIEVWENGVRLQENFFRDSPIVTQTTNERGLLGVAFDPNYAANRRVYVHYTTTASDNHNRISRFIANAAGDLALPGTEQILLELDPHSSTQHFGGAIHFGLDGKLYIPNGDNGNQNNGTSTHNSQRMDKLDGKVIRINPDGSIPTDNPFYNQTTGKYRAIWALGLRNPFTFAVQPGTGRIFINDVGQAVAEEINEGIAGANYGWPMTEGDFNQASFPTLTRPFFAYGHDQGVPSGCAIAGGAFYNPLVNRLGSDFLGDYFFGDYCAGKIFRLDTTTRVATEFITIPPSADSIVDVSVDRDGYLYYLVRNSGDDPQRQGIGEVFKVAPTLDPSPEITQHPAGQTVAIGQSASFEVVASGLDLHYRWQRADPAAPADFADIPGAVAADYTIVSAQPHDNGARLRVVVSSPLGTVISDAALLTVTSNHAPIPSIVTPWSGTLYYAGQTISFSGEGHDEEDGTMVESAFSWEIRAYHDDGNLHYHPFQTFSGTTNGSFVIPTSGETSANTWYRLLLTVTDSHGAFMTAQRDIFPQTVTVALATDPPGVPLTLDGQPAPPSFVGVVGIQRTLGAPANHVLPDGGYAFDSWSDGGEATRVIFTPSASTTFTARFAPSAVPGVLAEFFDFTTTSQNIPNLVGLTPTLVRSDAQINYPLTSPGAAWTGLDSRFVETFASRHSGYLKVNQSGAYTLYLNSNDGSRLWLDDQLVINNDGRHAMLELSAVRTLAAGYYPLRVEFHQALNAAGLILSWAGPGISKQVIPAGNFVQVLPGSSPPAVSSSQFIVDESPPQRMRFSFNRDILGSLSGGDLVLTNLSTGAPVSQIGFVYTPQLRQAEFHSLDGPLPDGSYRAVLPAGAVDDLNDLPTVTDAVLEFFVLAGDANRDRLVDTRDFNVLTGNFVETGKVFSQGNFNYDPLGDINSLDFNLFIGQYGKRLVASSPAPAAPLFAEVSGDVDELLDL